MERRGGNVEVGAAAVADVVIAGDILWHLQLASLKDLVRFCFGEGLRKCFLAGTLTCRNSSCRLFFL